MVGGILVKVQMTEIPLETEDKLEFKISSVNCLAVLATYICKAGNKSVLGLCQLPISFKLASTV